MTAIPSPFRLLPGLGAAVLIAWSPLAVGTMARPAEAADASPPLFVEILTAHRVPSRRSVALTGEIKARDTLRAAFPVNGRIERVLVSEGDFVRKGDELARIEQVQQSQDLRAARAGIETAEADLLRARNDFKRKQELLERGAGTRAARDDAEDTLRSAEASVALARADLDIANKGMSDTVLLAPADAIVTLRDAEVGQVVGAAQTVIELALGAEYDAVFNVPEVEMTRPARVPPPVELTLIDVEAPTFRGEVREISPLIDPRLGTVLVKVAVIDPPAGIGFGASVRGRIEIEEPPNVDLPFTVLTATAEGPAVWIVSPEDQSVALRQVRILRHETGRVLISEGVADGEQVVGLGAQLLFPGRKVAPARIDAASEGTGQ